MERQKCFILATHFDDEYLMFGSFLINYAGDIHILFTHQGDCISRETYGMELIEHEAFTNSLCKYREAKGYGKYKVEYFPGEGGVNRLGVTVKTHEEICERAESLLLENWWEYYLYSCNSIHSSHRQSNIIAESLLRDPYIFHIQKILTGTYDPECMFPVEDAGKFCALRVISEEDMDCLVDIGRNYSRKLKKFPEEQFRKILRYNGLKVKKPYAQGFSPRHIVLADL